MAESVFLFRREFRCGFIQRRDVKVRIVAEAVAASGRIDNFAGPAAFTDDRSGVGGVAHKHQCAVEMGVAVVLACQFLNEFGVVVGVTGAIAGEAGGVDAGGAVERVHAEAGVVRQRGKAGLGGGIAGFEQRIFNKAQAGLLGFVYLQVFLAE